ncbi:kicstor complex protein c12orf66 [Holotrichia oblita]|uniref:Kicstor complex protein c12orf66 n=1 Tax=Holotrichia oblita TaxID=644536 RepID=A0ACB9T736_HOLOL|nr:kicstor complex protein c12orf66 [Holotrichia oblita]
MPQHFLKLMEAEDAFLHNFFSYTSQGCYEKAKESVERERQSYKVIGPWQLLLTQLIQIASAEKSYMEIGFLQNKNKGFLRKDNSLKAIYETIKSETKKIEETAKIHMQDRKTINYCQNIIQYLTARTHLIDFYEKIYQLGLTKSFKYNELVISIDNVTEEHLYAFTDISLTPIRDMFSFECEILKNLFKAMNELQKLQFLPSLALIHSAHTTLSSWKIKLQNRETWKLGFLKNNQLPALFDWLLKLKGAILSKFSLYFHNTLALQTSLSDMRQLCSKLLYDNYQKMIAFQKKNDASILILSDNQITEENDTYPIIISYPQKINTDPDIILKMIADTSEELVVVDKVIYKYLSQEHVSYIYTLIEPGIYLVLTFENKKIEKDSHVINFITELCTNLRCTKIFLSLKAPIKSMFRVSSLNLRFMRTSIIRRLSDGAKPEPKPVSSIFSTDTTSSTSSDSKTKDVLAGVYVKVGQVDTIPEAPAVSSAFEDVPGPVFLKRLARFWTFVPVGANCWSNNLWLFRWLLDEYGPVVRLHGPFGGDVVIVSRPEHASTVFQNEGPYPIRSTLDCVEKYRLQHRKYKNAGPFVMYGPEWEKLRKSIEQPLMNALLQQYDKIDTTCSELIDQIHKWSLECLCSVMFNRHIGFLDPRGLSSTSEPAVILESLNGATNAIRKCESGLHLWKFFETPAWKSLVMHCDTIDNILTKYIRKAQDRLREYRNKGIEPKSDDMSLLERFLLGEAVLPEDMQTILLDMMLIGVNTTSHAAAFLLYHLARFPRTQQKLYDEIKSLPAKIDKNMLMNLPYLKACIQESLRLQPPMPILNRILTKDIVVHGYKIPKGTYMLIATKLSSLREEHFEDSLKFKPERWMYPELGKDMESMATIPFGHGAKACLAKDLAEAELSLLIYKLLRKFRVEYHYGDIGSTNTLIASPFCLFKF